MLDPGTIADLCRPAFTARAGLRAAFVFGSVARGRATPSSDVDIAVVGRDLDLLALTSELALLLKREVDVVEVSPESPIPLLRAILREGRRLYERQPGDAATFAARARTVLDLDGPNYDFMIEKFMAKVARRGVGA